MPSTSADRSRELFLRPGGNVRRSCQETEERKKENESAIRKHVSAGSRANLRGDPLRPDPLRSRGESVNRAHLPRCERDDDSEFLSRTLSRETSITRNRSLSTTSSAGRSARCTRARTTVAPRGRSRLDRDARRTRHHAADGLSATTTATSRMCANVAALPLLNALAGAGWWCRCYCSDVAVYTAR